MAESTTDHHFPTFNLHSLLDLRHLTPSDISSLSISLPSQRSREEYIAPVINRSVFNESAGSRKQTYSRLRLIPRDKQPASRPATAVRAPRPISEAVEQENSKIISLLQDLFGVEHIPKSNVEESNGGGSSLVPVPVEFQHSLPESAAVPLLNVPIDVGDSSQRKRKRGRPRKNENLAIVIAEEEEPKPKRKRGRKPKADPKKVVEGVAGTDVAAAAAMVNEKDLPFDAVAVGEVGDPFGEELKRRTRGMENEEQLLAFLEGLNGEWGSDRKKRRIVLASELGDLLPKEWKIILILQKRAGRASVICRRYVRPDGHQFDSYKEVSTYLLSHFGVQDINHLKSSYADGSNINVALESKGVDCVPKGDMKADANAIQLLIVKQATASSIENEKLNSSDGNSNNGLNLGCKLGDSVGSTFRCHGNNIEGKHLISSVEDMGISDGKPAKDGSQQIISTRNQSEMPKDSAEGKRFDNVPGGYVGNVSVSACLQDASKSGGVFVAPSKAAEDISTDQRSKMDSLLMSNEYLSAFDDYVNNISAGTLDALDGNKSCLSEPSQSEVKMFQTDPVDMPKFQ
ncbi:PREDICTED: methyl-CpG-binding domain-containing protein 8-like isoform X1 [Lupinus angustifolius]|uniref:methyl-CpG-binding domain-containing protein 8-like isoform X1 n=1 Tax=Lupinus angustifolius TaxID=3871 RepID=UPI00092FC785|nr:PREDICTED: methyl-CpG-binding domain-containing protein 8-like isoform X1 [Lupinus angustifolius]